MTDPEIRLKVLEILVPNASRHGIEKADLVKDDGIAEKFVEFVKKESPAKAKTDKPKGPVKS